MQPVTSCVICEKMTRTINKNIILRAFHLLIFPRRRISKEVTTSRARKTHHGNLFFTHSVPRTCFVADGVVSDCVDVPKTPGINPAAGPVRTPPPTLADSSLENGPGAHPLPALTTK